MMLFDEEIEKKFKEVFYLASVNQDIDEHFASVKEELLELALELQRKDRGKINHNNTISEMADVIICMKWLLHYYRKIFDGRNSNDYDFDSAFNNIILEKLNKWENQIYDKYKF